MFTSNTHMPEENKACIQQSIHYTNANVYRHKAIFTILADLIVNQDENTCYCHLANDLVRVIKKTIN